MASKTIAVWTMTEAMHLLNRAGFGGRAEEGYADRVPGLVLSEFGRRVAENGSRGADHGQAAPMFIFGKPVRPGLQGIHPSLDALADGGLTYHTDFCSVYAAVLEDWLHVDSQSVVGAQFEKASIV